MSPPVFLWMTVFSTLALSALYNTAITRQPERLPQAAGRADGGDSAASPVSGRDIIENLDENGKRFADCREKLKAWQNSARKLDLAR